MFSFLVSKASYSFLVIFCKVDFIFSVIYSCWGLDTGFSKSDVLSTFPNPICEAVTPWGLDELFICASKLSLTLSILSCNSSNLFIKSDWFNISPIISPPFYSTCTRNWYPSLTISCIF